MKLIISLKKVADKVAKKDIKDIKPIKITSYLALAHVTGLSPYRNRKWTVYDVIVRAPSGATAVEG